MSAILGRIHFNGSPINTDLFLRAFNLIHEYGKDKSNIWADGNIALGCHLLEITPEAQFEEQPHVYEKIVVVSDARIDNREEICELLCIPSVERCFVPDSHLIARAYKRWGGGCTSHLLGDFAFAIWDKRKQQLFCARDHIGVRPLFYYQSKNVFIFTTDIKALKGFPDINLDLNELQIAEFLIWPKHPLSATFFNDIYIVPPASQLVVSEQGTHLSKHWKPENAPRVFYKKTSDYADHLRDLLEKSIAARIRTDYPIGSHISGGLDSSGVTVLANKKLNEIGRSLNMAYTWSPAKSEKYPPVKGDERDRIEAIILQEGLPCHYGTSTGRDLFNFLKRDMALESTADVFEELSVMRHAHAQNIRVMLSGWGGDEGISFNGMGYLPYLLKTGNLFKLALLMRDVARKTRRKKEIINIFNKFVLFPLLPDYLYKRTYEPQKIKKRGRYVDSEFAVKFFGENYQEINYNYLRLVGDPKIFQKNLIASGALGNRMLTWAIWSAPFNLMYSYPLTDKRILNFSIGLPRELLYKDEQWRYIAGTMMKNILPAGFSKNDKVNEIKRLDQVQEAWSLLAGEAQLQEYSNLDMPWINLEKLYQDIKRIPNKTNTIEALDFLELMSAVRVRRLWEIYCDET